MWATVLWSIKSFRDQSIDPWSTMKKYSFLKTFNVKNRDITWKSINRVDFAKDATQTCGLTFRVRPNRSEIWLPCGFKPWQQLSCPSTAADVSTTSVCPLPAKTIAHHQRVRLNSQILHNNNNNARHTALNVATASNPNLHSLPVGFLEKGKVKSL